MEEKSNRFVCAEFYQITIIYQNNKTKKEIVKILKRKYDVVCEMINIPMV
jgi:hypothetical protein